MQHFANKRALKYIEGNPEENIPNPMSLVDPTSACNIHHTSLLAALLGRTR